MTSENRHYGIEGGPSKFDLMVADYDNSNDHPRFITFGIANSVEIRENDKAVGYLEPQPCNVMIYGTEREDGSGERRLFKGYTAEGGCFKKGIRVHGYYDIKRRTGWIEFENDPSRAQPKHGDCQRLR